MIEEGRVGGTGLAARYEELRAKVQRGEMAMERLLVQRQGLPAWIEEWQRCAPAQAAAPPRPWEGAAVVVPRPERAAMVQLVAGMVLGRWEEGRQ